MMDVGYRTAWSLAPADLEDLTRSLHASPLIFRKRNKYNDTVEGTIYTDSFVNFRKLIYHWVSLKIR